MSDSLFNTLEQRVHGHHEKNIPSLSFSHFRSDVVIKILQITFVTLHFFALLWIFLTESLG